MNVVDWAFGVVEAISPISKEEAANLKSEINMDISKVVSDPTHENYQPTMKAKVLHFFHNPWVRFALAASFVVVVKMIKDWYNGKYDQQIEE